MVIADPQVNSRMVPSPIRRPALATGPNAASESKKRSLANGYYRGWGLQFGSLADRLARDRLFQAALHNARLPGTESLLSDVRLMNLYLLLTEFVPSLAHQNVLEAGSFRCGTALFFATVLKEVAPDARVYALDTFDGMPGGQPEIDIHRRGEFVDVDVGLICQRREALGLQNLEIVPGDFRDTLDKLPTRSNRTGLAHVDCDIAESVEHICEHVWEHLTSGAYLVFDDDLTSSCLGATQAVELMMMKRKVHSEQAWPHHVFRNEADQVAEPSNDPYIEPPRLRQCRTFITKPVPESALQSILRIAHASPSVANQKPWRIVRLTSPEARVQLEESFAVAESITLEGTDAEFQQKYAALGVRNFLHAPVQLSVFTETALDSDHQQGWATMPEALEYSSVGMLMRLWAATEAMGLRGAWVSCLEPIGMQEAFAERESWKFTAHFALGWPRGTRPDKSKHELVGLGEAPPLRVFEI